MLLYRGSNKLISQPKINPKSGLLDCGEGAYFRTSKKEAARDAQEITKRLKCGQPIINVYQADLSEINKLKVLNLKQPNIEWLQFLADCRSGRYSGSEYDIIFALDAGKRFHYALRNFNDQDMSKANINFYLNGPAWLKDKYIPFMQVVFKTEKALSLLSFKESIAIKQRKLKKETDLFGDNIIPLINYAAEKTGNSDLELLKKLYCSKLYTDLTDPYLKTWQLSGRALGEILLEELASGKLFYPDED